MVYHETLQKYLRKCYIIYLVTRVDHAHFMSVRRTKWVWSARGGHVTLATPPFEAILRSYVRTVPGNVHVKFEVRSFNRFGLISI